MRRMIRVGALAMILSLGAVQVSQAQHVIAQYSQQDDQSSTRYRGRGMKGIVKLGIAGVVLVAGGIGWVIKKAKGE